jgi:TPR repeat protein
MDQNFTEAHNWYKHAADQGSSTAEKKIVELENRNALIDPKAFKENQLTVDHEYASRLVNLRATSN